MSTILEYNKVVIDHFNQPRNAAGGPDADYICGEGGSADKGAWVEFQLKLQKRRIQQARFRAYGCPHTIALASWLTDRLVGEQLREDHVLDKKEVADVLGLPAEKMRSVLIAEDALRDCADKLSGVRA